MVETRVIHASIVVDLRHARCDQCKVVLRDELATECPTCGAQFDAILTNHVGLDTGLKKKREEAGVSTYSR